MKHKLFSLLLALAALWGWWYFGYSDIIAVTLMFACLGLASTIKDDDHNEPENPSNESIA